MSINNFKPFASSPSANVETQAGFEANPALANGFQTGVANSALLNKVWRQSAFTAAAIGEFIKNAGFDALDNGDLASYVQSFLNAKGSFLNKNVAGLSNFTLNPLTDANHATLYFWGALTSNITITIPAGMPAAWNIINSTVGAFTLTIVAPSNTVAIASNSANVVATDGNYVWVIQSSASAGATGPAGGALAGTYPNPNVASLNAVTTGVTQSPGTANTTIATTQFVNAAVSAGGGKAGEYFYWPVASAPSSGLVCNGTAVSRVTYSALFASIGTVFGAGDGSTTFNIPNMPIGYTLSHTIGSEGSTTVGQVISHLHNIPNALGGSYDGGAPYIIAGTVPGGGTNTASTGGVANLAASMRARLCIRF